jgi:hypothetical protein
VNDLRSDLAVHLRSLGWREPTETGPAGGLWSHDGVDWTVPVPHQLSADNPAWSLILERLALLEDVPAEEVARRIQMTAIDVANLRAANDLVIADTIPYSAGVTLVQSGWTMLRTCATTSMGTRGHLRGNYRKRADAIVEAARLAHTRRGSYIIPIYLRLSETPTYDDSMIDAATAPPEPTERRVMRTFAEALAAVESYVVIADKEPNAETVRQLIRAGVSTEFALALHRLLTEEAVSSFTTNFEWAPAGGTPPSTPQSVGIPSAAAPLLQRVAEKLRTADRAPGVESLTGPVIGVWGSVEEGGRVTIDTARASRSVHVSVNVSGEVLGHALDWMKQRTTVVVEGRIRRVGEGLACDRRDSVSPLTDRHLFSD